MPATTLPARSGCDASTPVSRTATVARAGRGDGAVDVVPADLRQRPLVGVVGVVRARLGGAGAVGLDEVTAGSARSAAIDACKLPLPGSSTPWIRNGLMSRRAHRACRSEDRSLSVDRGARSESKRSEPSPLAIRTAGDRHCRRRSRGSRVGRRCVGRGRLRGRRTKDVAEDVVSVAVESVEVEPEDVVSGGSRCRRCRPGRRRVRSGRVCRRRLGGRRGGIGGNGVRRPPRRLRRLRPPSTQNPDGEQRDESNDQRRRPNAVCLAHTSSTVDSSSRTRKLHLVPLRRGDAISRAP